MSNDMNSVVVCGRLTKDSENKTIGSGMAICSFSLAINGYKDSVSFIDCTAFGKTAENLGKYLTKGQQIIAEGSLKQDRWEKDGQSRSKIGVNVNNIQLLGGKPTGQQGRQVEHKEAGLDNGCFEESDIPF